MRKALRFQHINTIEMRVHFVSRQDSSFNNCTMLYTTFDSMYAFKILKKGFFERLKLNFGSMIPLQRSLV